MKIICSDINLLKVPFEAISKIVNEVQMEVDGEGIRLNAINSSHTTFIHLNINEEEFDIYDVKTPQKISFSTHEFLAYLKRIGKNDLIELSVDENHIIIKVEGNTTKTFKMKLIDMDYDTPPIPQIDYPISVKINSKMFKEICMDIAEFSQKIRISNDGENIIFDAFGDFTDAEIIYAYQNNVEETYTSIYDMGMIKDLLKADKFTKKSTFSFGENMPLYLEMKSEDENQELCFMLAPRIEE